MKTIAGAKTLEDRVFKLKGANLKDYIYTKKYYTMENGIPTVSDKGDDSALTIINIRKKDKENADNPSKRAFVFSEGYIGAEKAYNEDGTKKISISRKSAFGISFLMDYIDKASENNIDDFNVVFMGNKEKSENQAELFAQAIQDISDEKDIKSINMWCHSKSGILALRAFQKLKDRDNPNAEKALDKVKAVFTSMPAKGVPNVDRESIINKIESNKILKVLPFSGHIKSAVLSFYDNILYKPCPAQVDVMRPMKSNEENGLTIIKEKTPLRKAFDIIWGNKSFEEHKRTTKNVERDAEYLPRTLSDENMEKIKDVKYKTLPVDLQKQDALISLLKHGQLMPFVLYAKKVITKAGEKGDGINSFEIQGVDKELGSKLKMAEPNEKNTVRACHDVPTNIEKGMEKIAQEVIGMDREAER